VVVGVRCAVQGTKQIASHFGGTRQGMVIPWPGHINDPGGIRTQFHHLIDIVPTILEAIGIEAPKLVDGIEQKPIEGVSMVYTFDKANANAKSKHTTQYFEMMANRAIYHDGWIASTTPPAGPWHLGKKPNPESYTWELYNIDEDYSQANDLATKQPDKLRELQQVFLAEEVSGAAARPRRARPRDRPCRLRAAAPFAYAGELTGTPDAPNISAGSIRSPTSIPRNAAEGVVAGRPPRRLQPAPS
jgi:arylsulfatase